MTSVSRIWAGVLVLGMLAIGSAVFPFQSFALDRPPRPALPVVANATLAEKEAIPGRASFQETYIHLSVTTDKPAYLIGDTVAITMTTSVPNTSIFVMANLPGGTQQTIGSFTTSSQKTILWTAPATPGQVQFTCQGQAELEIWSTCTRYVCVDTNDCHLESFPCLRSAVVSDSASTTINVFSRTTSISGRIMDTNQQPVPGAIVSLANISQVAKTNADGSYVFPSYQLGSNYTLVNNIPAVTETVSASAIACEPQAAKTIQVLADTGASNVDFTLMRAFYPPAIDLSQFTFDNFSSWPEASNYSTWQNTLGITIGGAVQLKKLSYGSTAITAVSFDISNKTLYLVTSPSIGNYLIELQGQQKAAYMVAAAATISNRYLLPVSVSGTTESKAGQRIKLTLNETGLALTPLKAFPLLAVIIPVIVVIIGGLVAADLLTGRRVIGRIGPAFGGVKSTTRTNSVGNKTKESEAKTQISRRRNRTK